MSTLDESNQRLMKLVDEALAPVTPIRPKPAALEAIEAVATVVTGLPVYIAGSAVAAARYPMIDDTSYDDVDIFCGSDLAMISAAQRLLSAGFQLDDRFSRVWARWMRMGFKSWHTNSLKLELPGVGIKVNLVWKLVDGHPTTSLAQVIESFDFGLLAQGLDAERGSWHDMRSYLFPGKNPDGALPLMPNKRANWRQGFISQYNGLREVGRYAKYHGYGFDMSEVKDDLITGYFEAALYLKNRDDQAKQQLGLIYESIAMQMEADNLDQLAAVGAELPFMDDLDRIMEALE